MNNQSIDEIVEQDLPETLDIGGIEFDVSDFHDAYRNGNFGIRRGKIRIEIAARWSVVHLMIAFLITVFALTNVFIMAKSHYVDGDLDVTFASVTILCGLLAIATAYSGIYLAKHLATLRRPLFLLLLVRLLAFMECILVMTGFATTVSVVALCRSYNGGCPAVIIIGVLLAVLLVFDWFTAALWLYHWWKCCNCCDCFKSLAIFEPGQPLADGVSDPKTGILSECAYICWSVYRSDVISII